MTGEALRVLHNLELHLTHSCNLTCESCSHYSNQGHKGLLSLEDADCWMSLWAGRIAPDMVSLLGGEPSMHPLLPEFVTLTRRHWPRTHIRMVSNGFFLHRHPTLPVVLRDDPNAALYLSIHHDDPAYQERLKPVLALLRGWKAQHGTRIRNYESYKNWTRRYTGFGAQMAPFEDGQPRQSWEKCPARYCPQLFEGRLWKCGPITYLKLQDAKYGLSEKWDPYLRYAPLPPECSDQALNEFLDREEEDCCNMCPAAPERFRLPIPLRSLSSTNRVTASVTK